MILKNMKLNSKLTLYPFQRLHSSWSFFFEMYFFTTCTWLVQRMTSKSFNLVMRSYTEDLSPRFKTDQKYYYVLSPQWFLMFLLMLVSIKELHFIFLFFPLVGLSWLFNSRVCFFSLMVISGNIPLLSSFRLFKNASASGVFKQGYFQEN